MRYTLLGAFLFERRVEAHQSKLTKEMVPATLHPTMNSRLVTFVVAVVCEAIVLACQVAALVVLANTSDPIFAMLLALAICFFVFVASALVVLTDPSGSNVELFLGSAICFVVSLVVAASGSSSSLTS